MFYFTHQTMGILLISIPGGVYDKLGCLLKLGVANPSPISPRAKLKEQIKRKELRSLNEKCDQYIA